MPYEPARPTWDDPPEVVGEILGPDGKTLATVRKPEPERPPVGFTPSRNKDDG